MKRLNLVEYSVTISKGQQFLRNTTFYDNFSVFS
jgi:hypothetical protein